MIEILFYILGGLGFITFGLDCYSSLEKRASQKSIRFELSDEDFALIKRGGHFYIKFKHGKSAIDWDHELKKL